MGNNTSRLSELQLLFTKYTNSECTREELERLVELCKNGPAEVFATLPLPAPKGDGPEPFEGNWEAAFNDILDRVKRMEGVASVEAGKDETNVSLWHGRRTVYTKRAAAAAIIAVLILLGTLVFKNDNKDLAKKDPIESRPVTKELGPGSNKAILILSGGEQILLDSAFSGEVAIQGGSKLVKTGGQLTYDATDTSLQLVYNTIRTPKGGQYQVVLADGTKVWLNAASSLRYPTAFHGKDRTVELEGEGYFEVTHDHPLPFYVRVKGVDVKVLGTQFNVNSYQDEKELQITLLRGSVEVKSPLARLILKPSQQAVLNNADGQLILNNSVNMEAVMAWKNGYFYFGEASLSEVLRQIERWYDLEVVFVSRLPARKFSGEIARNTSLADVLKVLEESDVHFEVRGRQLIVKP